MKEKKIRPNVDLAYPKVQRDIEETRRAERKVRTPPLRLLKRFFKLRRNR